MTILVLTVIAAAFVQGVVGIGFSLIVAPIMAIFEPHLLPASLLLLVLPLNTFVAWREHRALDRASVAWVTLGRVMGTLPGLWVVLALTESQLEVVVGATTILAVLATIAAPPFTPGRRGFAAAGLVTGVVETSTGIGGPPLALIYQYHSAPALRASIAACFAIGQIVSLASLAILGRLAWPQLAAAAILWPAAALGVVSSRVMHGRLDQRRLRLALLAFALVSGLALLIRS